MDKKRVLILCTGNSCRSQMAEGLWNALAADQWEAHSAGSHPTGYVHPLAVDAMAEAGIDIRHHRSKSLDQYVQQPFDLVVTVCDHAAEACPTLPGTKHKIHWSTPDPAGVDSQDPLEAFRKVRDELKTRIETWLVESRD